jgi:threonine dehydratase
MKEKVLYDIYQDSIYKSHVRRTPLISLTEKRNLFCKLECCQIGGSFKIRGSFSTLLTLKAQGRTEGVITASMGNTATGLAYAGRLLNYPVAVVMPETVSRIKLKATQAIGAEVILKGVVGDDAIAHAMEVAQRRNILFVHPHKTAPFLNGNGTIAQEILGELPSVEQIFIPIGGGGLASGVCQHIEGRSLSVKAIGVEAEQAPAFHLSFKTGRPVRLEKMDTIADALTLMEPDPEVFSYLYKNLAEVVTVSEEEIVSAMKILFDEFRVIAEPGGAAPLAAMLKGNPNVPSAAIISGGNVSLGEFQTLLSRLES